MRRSRGIRPSLAVTVAAITAILLTGVDTSNADHEFLLLSGTPHQGSVNHLKVSADGNWAVYTTWNGSVGNLYSTPLGTDEPPTPKLLNTTPAHAHSVGAFAISPDSQWVVYRGDLEVDGVSELYSRPIDGSGSQERISSATGDPARSPNDNIEFTSDSQRVVFTGDLNTDNHVELFSGEVDGTPDAELLSSTAVDGHVRGFVLSPDGQQVVYWGGLEKADNWELFTRPVDASSPQVRLSDKPILVQADKGVRNAIIDSASETVVYAGDLVSKLRFDLYRVPLDGNGSQEYLNPLDADADVESESIRLTPDGSRTLFVADLNHPDTDELELFSVPTDGSDDPITLSESSWASALVDDDSPIVVVPDGTRVLYFGTLEGERTDLYSAPVDSPGGQLRLNDPANHQWGSVSNNEVLLTPDGERVVYRGLLESADAAGLYSAPIDTEDGQVRLDSITSPLDDGPDDFFQLTPDGGSVVFTSEVTNPSKDELFIARVDQAGTQQHLAGDGSADMEVGRFSIRANGAHIVMYGDLQTENVTEVFSLLLAPLPISQLAAGQATHDSATLTWQAPAFGRVDEYSVTLSPPPPSPGRQATASTEMTTTDTSIVLSDLAPETTYTASVRSSNHAGTSEVMEVQFTTSAAPPAGGVHRLSGTNRYETAVQVALDRFDPAEVDTVYLAVGSNFPDALAGGPLAAQDGAPILLTPTASLPDVVATALSTLAPSKVIAFGGTAAITNEVLTAAGAAAGGGATTDRISGANRYETAAAIAAAMDTTGVDTAYLATGTNFPDALAGGPATNGAPILLSSSTGLPTATSDALADLAPSTVTALGGIAAVPEATLDQAATAAGGATTTRLSGPERFTTATAIAATLTNVEVAYIAVGTNFPDALAAGPAAFAEGAPIVLVRTDTLPAPTADYLGALPALRRIVILGGTGAISEPVATQLAALID